MKILGTRTTRYSPMAFLIRLNRVKKITSFNKAMVIYVLIHQQKALVTIRKEDWPDSLALLIGHSH